MSVLLNMFYSDHTAESESVNIGKCLHKNATWLYYCLLVWHYPLWSEASVSTLDVPFWPMAMKCRGLLKRMDVKLMTGEKCLMLKAWIIPADGSLCLLTLKPLFRSHNTGHHWTTLAGLGPILKKIQRDDTEHSKIKGMTKWRHCTVLNQRSDLSLCHSIPFRRFSIISVSSHSI